RRRPDGDGARRLHRLARPGLKRFQEKWEPVFRSEPRQSEGPVPGKVGTGFPFGIATIRKTGSRKSGNRFSVRKRKLRGSTPGGRRDGSRSITFHLNCRPAGVSARFHLVRKRSRLYFSGTAFCVGAN